MSFLCELMAFTCCDGLAQCNCRARIGKFLKGRVASFVAAVTFRSWG